MVLAKPAVFALASLSLLACSGNDLTNPDNVDPLFAKPVKVQEPVIHEFWVVPGVEDAPDIIHVVVSDNVHTVNPSLVYDYFHNGIVDDDPPYDQHFEIFSSGPPSSVVDDLKNGWVHVDIPWDGGMKNPEHLTIELPGEGDPYSIFLPLHDAAGNTLDWARPRGVVLGGVETKLPEVNLSGYDQMVGPSHHAGNVRSFATSRGVVSNQYMSLSGLSMANLQCKKATTTTGQGKTKVVETVYRLSAEISVSVDRPQTPPDPDERHVWFEGHFRALGSGEISHRFAASNVGNYELTLNMPPSWDGTGDVEFVVDFLSGIGITQAMVYNPWESIENDVPTTAGFDGPPWNKARTGLEDGMAFPVAHTIAVPAGCR